MFEVAPPRPTLIPELSDCIVAHTLLFVFRKVKHGIVLETRNSPLPSTNVMLQSNVGVMVSRAFQPLGDVL